MMPPAVILILIIFFITACEANFLENSENETFSLAKAKEYSLQNASVLKFPTAKPSFSQIYCIICDRIGTSVEWGQIL